MTHDHIITYITRLIVKSGNHNSFVNLFYLINENGYLNFTFVFISHTHIVKHNEYNFIKQPG